ncbi:hypothetical protein GN244_ATG06379 [Phytophthora infestans]|uniref:Uncharacterized protein n=1 Tax=Phytophthora infestans TaxID=4787 RepID=A0A833S621_PHYIN|nr:hypothetical protein GN244_ATG06379 [Phytophthora infestans]KAF4129811.1 hypothetical protein GN958_ATG20977 [Phytophthora infestans]
MHRFIGESRHDIDDCTTCPTYPLTPTNTTAPSGFRDAIVALLERGSILRPRLNSVRREREDAENQ